MDRENQSEINIKYCRLLLFDEACVDFRLVIARERKKKTAQYSGRKRIFNR